MADFQGSLPVKSARDNELKVLVVDFSSGETATQGLSIDANGAALVVANDLDIRNLVFATDKVDVSGSSVDANITNASLVVEATDLDIRNLNASQDNVAISDGTNTLAVNTDGSLNVVISEFGESRVCSYTTSAAVAKDTSVNHDYVITSGKVFRGFDVLVGARGNCKVEGGLFDGSTFTPKFTYVQQPGLNLPVPIKGIEATGDGTLALRLTITNLDNTSDLYSTIQGVQE